MGDLRSRRDGRNRLPVGAAVVLAAILAGCGSSPVAPAPSATPDASLAADVSQAPSPSASPSATPSDSPSPSPTVSPSPSPSPTPVPPLAITHCSGKAGRPSSTAIFSTEKDFAGYLASGTTKTVTCVEASWVQPAIKCATTDSKSDVTFSVAIGGYDGHGTTGSHQRPEKAATEAYCDGGTPIYVAWTYSVQAKDAGLIEAPLLIRPGDQIWAQVSASGHNFKMTIADLTSNHLSAVSATVKDATRENAQWNVEGIEYGCPKHCAPGPLANFGTFRMSGAETTIGGIFGTVDRWAHQATTMATGSLKRATVSRLGRGTFTVVWHHL